MSLFVVFTGMWGCPSKPPATPEPNAAAGGGTATEAVVIDRTPGVVELTSSTAHLDAEKVVRFSINYKFTSGEPVKHYLVDIAFIGANRYGIKAIDVGTLTPEGVITTGIEVGDAPVKDYEIKFSEADSPDQGFRQISNTLTGTVTVPDATPANTGS